jgi:glucose/arabinose dehydrogenase
MSGAPRHSRSAPGHAGAATVRPPGAAGARDAARSRRATRRGRALQGLALALLASLIPCPRSAGAAVQLPLGFQDQLITDGLYFPVGIAFLPDGRLLVAESQGALRLVVDGKLGAVDPLVAVDSVRADAPGRGVLGIAADARWPASPYVYVCYEAADTTLRVSRFTATGDLDQAGSVFLALDPASRYDVLRDLPDQGPSNGGGTLRFGPDGVLYLSLGDDGDACAAQDSSALRGVVLRLDVQGLPPGPGGPPNRAAIAPADNPFSSSADPDARLVWMLGLRHPFRFHPDPVDGTLFIADIGEQSAEEVDRGDSGGMNFGWPFYEGDLARLATCPVGDGSGVSGPIHVYHDRSAQDQAAIIGAGIYRPGACPSCKFPIAYAGDYFFGDYYSGFLRRLKQVSGGWQIADPVAGQPSAEDWGRGFEGVSDYLVGQDGAIWYCRNGQGGGDGEIRRIVYDSTPVTGVPGAPASDVDFAPPAPSPARGDVRLEYGIARASAVRLEIFDAAGRRVRSLVAATQEAGRHRVRWDGLDEAGRSTPAGLYLARLSVDGAAVTRRIAVIR